MELRTYICLKPRLRSDLIGIKGKLNKCHISLLSVLKKIIALKYSILQSPANDLGLARVYTEKNLPRLLAV